MAHKWPYGFMWVAESIKLYVICAERVCTQHNRFYILIIRTLDISRKTLQPKFFAYNSVISIYAEREKVSSSNQTKSHVQYITISVGNTSLNIYTYFEPHSQLLPMARHCWFSPRLLRPTYTTRWPKIPPTSRFLSGSPDGAGTHVLACSDSAAAFQLALTRSRSASHQKLPGTQELVQLREQYRANCSEFLIPMILKSDYCRIFRGLAGS